MVLSTYTAPTPPVCVTQFMAIRSKLKAPFRITLRGVVADLSDMQLTQQEWNKRTFNLVDDAGMWVRCCALGLSARSRALARGCARSRWLAVALSLVSFAFLGLLAYLLFSGLYLRGKAFKDGSIGH